MIVHASADVGPSRPLRFVNLKCDGAGLSDYLIVAVQHVAEPHTPTRIIGCSFRRARKAALGWTYDGSEGPSQIELFDVVNCSFDGNEFWLSDGIEPGSRIRVQDARLGSLLLQRADQGGRLRSDWNARSSPSRPSPEVRVLYLIDDLDPAGAERSLAALVVPYRRRGIELDVACVWDVPGIQAELAADGAGVFCVDGPGGRIGRIRRARALIAARRPEIVHTTLFEADITGRLAAAAAGIPVVSSLVSSAYDVEQAAAPGLRPWKLRAAQLLDAVSARRVVRFHAISRHVADLMAAKLRIARDRVDVIPRGRDPERLGTRTRSPRRRPGGPGDPGGTPSSSPPPGMSTRRASTCSSKPFRPCSPARPPPGC